MTHRIVDLILENQLADAKTAIVEEIVKVKATKLLEMKKMVAAKMYVSEGTGSPALDKALAQIDKTFGPGGTHTSAAIKARTAKARADNPEFNAFLKRVGKKNPYKKDNQ